MRTIHAKKLEGLKDILKEMVEDQFVPGANCMVRQHGREICYFEYGQMDVAAGKPMARDTIFRMYSMSKPITALAAMILLQEGKLDLLTPVSKYFKSFENQYYIRDGRKIPVQMPVQIRHLLNMTSGLAYPGDIGDETDIQTTKLMNEVVAKLYTGQALSTEEFVDRLGEIPLMFEPGEAWYYGLSADVLGAVIEKVSGVSFGEFLQERIFEPLDMKDTAFYVPQEKQSRLAKVYDWDEVAGRLVEREPDHLGISTKMEQPPAFESGGAGLASTIDDYAKFTDMLTAKGKTVDGRELISEKTWEFMTTGQLTPSQKKTMIWDNLPGFNYGNLMRVMEQPGQAVTISSMGEYGWDGWLGAYMCNDPVDEVTLLIMNQKMNTGTTLYTRLMRNIMYAALE